MELRGVTPVCGQLWHDGALALVGISPFNSYFSTERIRSIIEHCEQGGRSVALFVPDDVTHYTLQARGYTEDVALRKTRRQIRYLRNKIDQAVQGRDVPVIGCEALAGNATYRERYAALQARFESDAQFRSDCLDTTGWVLSTQTGHPVKPDAALMGVNYLLAELPLFFNAPDILDRAKAVFVYHQCPALIARSFSARDPALISPGQGFGVLTSPQPTGHASLPERNETESLE